MDRAVVLERVRSQIASILEIDEEEIAEDTLLIDDLDADSLDLIDLVLLLQDEFNIGLSEGDLPSLLADLAEILPGLFIDEPLVTSGADLSDNQLHELGSQLHVGTIVEFVIRRLSKVGITSAEAPG